MGWKPSTYSGLLLGTWFMKLAPTTRKRRSSPDRYSRSDMPPGPSGNSSLSRRCHQTCSARERSDSRAMTALTKGWTSRPSKNSVSYTSATSAPALTPLRTVASVLALSTRYTASNPWALRFCTVAPITSSSIHVLITAIRPKPSSVDGSAGLSSWGICPAACGRPRLRRTLRADPDHRTTVAPHDGEPSAAPSAGVAPGVEPGAPVAGASSESAGPEEVARQIARVAPKSRDRLMLRSSRRDAAWAKLTISPAATRPMRSPTPAPARAAASGGDQAAAPPWRTSEAANSRCSPQHRLERPEVRVGLVTVMVQFRRQRLDRL